MRHFCFQEEILNNDTNDETEDKTPHKGVDVREKLIAAAAAKMDTTAVLTAFVDMMEVARKQVHRLGAHDRWLFDRAYQTLRENTDIRLHPNPMSCPK